MGRNRVKDLIKVLGLKYAIDELSLANNMH